MNLDEYASHDALGLAALVRDRQVTPTELARTAARAVAAINGDVNAVVELYVDRIDTLDERSLGDAPFRGVPFLMKDVFGFEAGRLCEFGSRLCRGMKAEHDSAYFTLAKAAGVNVLGRSAAPEYSMSGTTEGALHGNTSTPWRHGYSAGGSSGGAMAAVIAGIVPIAQGTDIAGSIRVPASFCGGVGLKPSRGRISYAPMVDENGYGLGQAFVQTRTIRDAASMLDCLSVPQVGDPFVIPAPPRPYAEMIGTAAPRLRVGWSTGPLMGFSTDPEVAAAVERTAQWLADEGHEVESFTPVFDGLAAMRSMLDVWFFGFDLRLAGFSKRSGHAIGPETLEPTVYKVYEYAKTMTAAQFLGAMSALNTVRRQLGTVFARYDVWLTPTTPRVAETWGLYHLGRDDIEIDEMPYTTMNALCQYTLPHNILGAPALSLPLAMHSSGLPIGVQLAAAPAHEHLLLQLGVRLEEAMPWKDRVPPLHVSRRPG